MHFKLSIAMLASCTTFAIFAQDSSLNSLSYRPKAQEFNYSLGLEKSEINFETSDYVEGNSGTTRRTFERNNTNWTNDFNYGVTDSLSFGLGLDLALNNELQQTAMRVNGTAYTGTSGAATATSFNNLKESNDGLKDIRLNSSYRYMKETVKADLIIGLAYASETDLASRNETISGNYTVS